MKHNRHTIWLYSGAALVVTIAVVLFACRARENNTLQTMPENKIKEKFVRANKIIVHNEAEEIDDYIRRHQLDMKVTGSGLRYMIYKNGKGSHPQENQKASILYTLHLLNGQVIYTTERGKPVTINLGKDEATRGLEEGILLMGVGDKAKLIVPSHLGFGVIGDGDKIKGKVTLLYDVELVSISEQN